MADQLYTLEEAQRILYEKECDRRGHDFSITVTMSGRPDWIACKRCGRTWAIYKDATTDG